MANIVISNVVDIGAGQLSCTVTVPDASWGVEPGVHDNYVVNPGDVYGLGPAVRALIEANVFEGDIAPFVPG